MQKRYKILVVDDSAFMRRIISDIISEDPEFEVAGVANNGVEAVEKCLALRPDAITMDLEMPEMDGLQALRAIMGRQPTPVIMLSGETRQGMQATIVALESGALDFIRKPSGVISLDLVQEKETLMEKLRLAVRTRVDRALVPKAPAAVPALPDNGSFSAPPLSPRPAAAIRQLVAIGTSTGGPKALQAVLSVLPAHFPAPILIVQHMPPQFTKSLAQRLDQLCSIRVVEASDGDRIEAGTAYIAPGGLHMILTKEKKEDYRIRLNSEEPLAGHRPSVDMMFQSLVPFTELKRHVVIMTGMGSDGAKGMKALQQAGAVSLIAESERTAVVYGMPRAAVELDCVNRLVDLDHIAAQVIRAVQQQL